jgi:hypothetical protein
MLKKPKIRLLTRAVQIRDCVFAGSYRAATVRESVPDGLLPTREIGANGAAICSNQFSD